MGDSSDVIENRLGLSRVGSSPTGVVLSFYYLLVSFIIWLVYTQVPSTLSFLVIFLAKQSSTTNASYSITFSS